MTKTLTTKQEAFILAYIGEARFNATKAAIIAGYTERSARSTASDLLTNPDIAARVQDELKKRSMPADAVLAELTDIATANWREFVEVLSYDDDGNPLKVKMDLSNKVKSLEILAKAHGILTDKIDISGSLTSTIELVGVAAEDV